MERKERGGTRLIKRIKSDYVFRTFVFSAFSFLVTLAFAVYNTFLGIAYKAVWNIGIAVYYALLLSVRAFVIGFERKFYKDNLTESQLEDKRKKLCLAQSVILLIIDVALIAPITVMALQKKAVDYSTIPAIAAAAYTTYKIVLSTKNIIRTKKLRHSSVKILRTVNFIDALVSVLTLQYTLIMTFGGGTDKNMFVLCAVSSFAIWVMIIVLSLKTLALSVKRLNKKI